MERRASRLPRNEPQLLRSLLEEDLPVVDTRTMSANIHSVSTMQHIWSLALAINKAAHLYTLKQFQAHFNQFAFATLADDTLRPPILPEIIEADRCCWQSIFSLQRDRAWTLDQAIHELTCARQEIASRLFSKQGAVSFLVAD